MQEVWQQFIDGMRQTGWLEYMAVFAGIASVWFSRREHVLVYPVGLVNTVIYVWLSIKGHLLGEASVNFYYSVMSVYGWIAWTRKDRQQKPLLQITRSTVRERAVQLLFFGTCYTVLFLALRYLQRDFAPGAIPWADALASAAAYTGMWLMTRKKVESWYWWIATNVASIPLYFVKGYVFTSVYYLILLAMAVSGLMAWRRKATENRAT
jgi:nicotinamide mononucleotide transporter